MSDSDHAAVRISREVPLDQLVFPETDVRENRPEDDVRGIAASMGDPGIGQQQPIAVFPENHADLPDEPGGTDLRDAYEDDVGMVIHDGVTRTLAAEQLGWSTIWAVIIPEPPEDELVARLDANTERIDMSDYETFKALYDWYQSSEATLEDVGEKVGMAGSTVSNIFSLFEAPEFIHNPWKHPDHPLGTSHAIAVRSFLTDSTLEAYQEAGKLGPEDARQRAIDDVKLMIDVQAQHELGVTDFRQRCKRCKKETKDSLRSQAEDTDPQAEGQKRAADQRDTGPTPEQKEPCMVCGGDRPSQRRKSIPVCANDYGMLADMESAGDVLMANSQLEAGPSGENSEEPTFLSEEHERLHALAQEVPPDQVAAFADSLQDALTEPAESGGD